MIRTHHFPLLAMAFVALLGLNQSIHAQEPEKLPFPKEVVGKSVAKEPPPMTKEEKKKKEVPPVDVKDVKDVKDTKDVKDVKDGKDEKKPDPKETTEAIAKAKESGDNAQKTADTAKTAADGAKTAADAAQAAANDGKNKGDTAWMLISSALVMLMVPGLALFYGGMVRKKNVLATMMQSYAALSVVGLFWIAFGYGLAFGPSILKIGDGGLLGWSSDLFFLQGIEATANLPGYNFPIYVHVMFQGMFAIVTPALISGALAERIRFWPFCLFMLAWVAFVYCPLAHMVWAFDWFYLVPVDADKGIGGSAIGLLGKMGALDFAGGTVVHIAAGTAGLAAALVLRKRTGYPEHAMHPNSMVLTLIGAGLLWFGWFGFNGGSSGASNALAGSAFAATQAAAAAAGLSWMLVEWLVKGKPTALGLASGIVAGLVAVTPASGYVYIWGGVIIGLLAGVVCYFAVYLKSKLGYDDSLDAFGVHAVGGFLGAVLTGLFCYAAVNSAGADGYFAIKGQRAKLAELREQFPDTLALDQLAELETKVKDAKAAVEKATADKNAAEVTKLKAELATAEAAVEKATKALKKSEATKKIEKFDDDIKAKDPAVVKAKAEVDDIAGIFKLAGDTARKASEKAKPEVIADSGVKLLDGLTAITDKKAKAVTTITEEIEALRTKLKTSLAAKVELEKQTPKPTDDIAKVEGESEDLEKQIKTKTADLETAKADQATASKFLEPLAKTLAKVDESTTKKVFDTVKEEKDKRTESYQKVAAELNTMKADQKKLVDAKASLKTLEEWSSKLFADDKGPLSQFFIQVKAAVIATVFALLASLALALLVHVGTGGKFTTTLKAETEGLDQTEHGEVGFDFTGGAYDAVPTGASTEPKAAKVPPGGKRFDVIVDGIENGGLMKAWSDLCQPVEGPIDADFQAVYPYVTTVQGNRFRLRGGDPAKLSAHILKLFQKKLGKQLKVRIEE